MVSGCTLLVIPAKAGILGREVSAAGAEIPASAGMTGLARVAEVRA